MITQSSQLNSGNANHQLTARRPVLVFEYLLADSQAWSEASPSMQREAMAMLSAIVNDLEACDTLRPVVLTSAEPAARLRQTGGAGAQPELIVCENGPAAWLQKPDRSPSAFDATLVIAPECDGLLVSLLDQLQTPPWQHVLNLNVPRDLAAVFTDKLRTASWLASHGIASPFTKTLNDAAVSSLLNAAETVLFQPSSDSTILLPPAPELAVIKPRDGVGCDRVSLITLSSAAFQNLPEACGDDDRWVIQPFVRGVPCSVGFLGGGECGQTLMLPPAEQEIRCVNGHLRYCGGKIPCASNLELALRSLADQLIPALGPILGYLGADIIVSPDGRNGFTAQVIEINPRLCTSYVGYRNLSRENLAARLIPGGSQRPVLWNSIPVQFSVSTEPTNLPS